MENDNCDFAGGQILLNLDALTGGRENVEAGCFGGREKVAVFESGESGEAGGLAIVAGQGAPETFIDAFLNRNAQLGTHE